MAACTILSDTMSSSEVYKSQGNAAYQQGKYFDAVDLYTKAITEDDQNAFLYGNRCAAYLMLKKYAKALDDASRSVLLKPDYSKGLIRYAKCCLVFGNLDECRRCCESARQLEPKNTEVVSIFEKLDFISTTYETFEKQFARNIFSHALHLITKCLEIAPLSTPFVLKQLHLQIQIKRFVDAKRNVEYTIQNSVDPDVELLYYRGLCLYYMEHSDKAISHFQHVLRMHPDHVQTQQAMKRTKLIFKLKQEGNDLIQAGKPRDALQVYNRALDIDPLHDSLNVKLFCNRAYAQYLLNEYDSALKDCTKALTIDKNNLRALERRVKCLTATESFDMALKECKRLVKKFPSREHQELLNTVKRQYELASQINYYKVLGVKQKATLDEIKQAYKKLALRHHPDRHRNADTETHDTNEQKFKEIAEAYSVLSDPQKRDSYDAGNYSSSGGSGNCAHSDINAGNVFNVFFQNGCNGASGQHASFPFTFS